MAGEVICPACGTASPGATRVCPKCGTSLDAPAGSTSKSAALKPPVRVVRRPAGDTGAHKTLPEDEPAPAPTPASPPPKSAPVRRGPVPGQQPLPRRSAPQRTTGTEHSTSGARDSLIGKSLQDYIIEKRLGVGGMGVVYRATHSMIGKAVAIKVLRADIVQDEGDMERLLDEARIISAIKNRGIINIFGAGTTEDGRHYLIMELLEGESLEQLMQREGTIPAGDAVIILEQVLSALTAAHETGVVHRDLKPANVFLVNEGNLTYVKLLDFGLARRNQQNVTRIAGTPDYISPEHARGRPAGPPADLYAFGILCFHMMTGKLPFAGTTPMEVMEKHVHHAPPVPHEVNREIPKPLSELILRLLAKDPGERPDATQVKADLRAATKHLRNAATMMSLMAIEAVGDKPPPEDQKRARELAVEAQVASLKRTVVRRWPWLVGGLVALWFIGIAIYFFSPAEPPPSPVPITRKPKPPPVDPDEPLEPPVKPIGTKQPEVVAVKQPDRPPEKQPDKVPDTTPDKQPEVLPEPDVTPDEAPDGSTPENTEEREDPNTPIDDVRLGELKRAKRIDERLDEIEAGMKSNDELRTMLGELVKRTRTRCDAATTLGDFFDCDDEVTKQYKRYLNNI